MTYSTRATASPPIWPGYQASTMAPTSPPHSCTGAPVLQSSLPFSESLTECSGAPVHPCRAHATLRGVMPRALRRKTSSSSSHTRRSRPRRTSFSHRRSRFSRPRQLRCCCARATLLCSTDLQPCLDRLGNLPKTHRDGESFILNIRS